MLSRLLSCAALALGLLVSGCGGGASPNTAASPAEALGALRAQARLLADVSPDEAARQLMNLGETAYPQYFPTHETTGTYGPFKYRFYAQTGIYLGVVVAQGSGYEYYGVYVMGGPFGNEPSYVGPLTQYITPVETPALPALTPLGAGEKYTMLYATYDYGLDMRAVTATFTVSGTLDAYYTHENEYLSAGSARTAEGSGTTSTLIGRWTEGLLAGKFYSSAMLHPTANQGFHYVVGKKPAALPCSGTGHYVLAAATKPTRDSGSVEPGTLDSLTVDVTYAGTGTSTFTAVGTATLGTTTISFNKTQQFQVIPTLQTFVINSVPSTGVNNGTIYGALYGAASDEIGVVLSGFAIPSVNNTALRASARLTRTSSTAVACP